MKLILRFQLLLAWVRNHGRVFCKEKLDCSNVICVLQSISTGSACNYTPSREKLFSCLLAQHFNTLHVHLKCSTELVRQPLMKPCSNLAVCVLPSTSIHNSIVFMALVKMMSVHGLQIAEALLLVLLFQTLSNTAYTEPTWVSLPLLCVISWTDSRRWTCFCEMFLLSAPEVVNPAALVYTGADNHTSPAYELPLCASFR